MNTSTTQRRARYLRRFNQLTERGDPAECRYCGVHVHPSGCCEGAPAGSVCVQFDHLTPVSRGGPNTLENLGLACGPCNMSKGARTEDEYRHLLSVRHDWSLDEIAAARSAGRLDVERHISEQAPTEPALRIAWMSGYRSVVGTEIAVAEARDAGVTWRAIAEALGENPSTVRVRYTQQDRYQRWKAKREDSDS